MKKIIYLILALSLTGGMVYSQDKPVADTSREKEEEKGIGLDAGLIYFSKYLWRGSYFYNGDGAFTPYLGYDILKSGLKFNFIAEVSESYIGEGSNDNVNHTAYANHGLDFGLEYSRSFAETVSLTLQGWYYWYYNSKHSYATEFKDASMITGTVSLSYDKLPVPAFISYSHDYYMDKNYAKGNQEKDFYIQFGFDNSENGFELTREVNLGVKLAAAYFYEKSLYRKGISDIEAALFLNFKKGSASLNSGFHYVIVPTKDFYQGSDIHRFFVTFGAGYSI